MAAADHTDTPSETQISTAVYPVGPGRLSFDDGNDNDSCRFSYANAEQQEAAGHGGSARIFDIFMSFFDIPTYTNCFPLFLTPPPPLECGRFSFHAAGMNIFDCPLSPVFSTPFLSRTGCRNPKEVLSFVVVTALPEALQGCRATARALSVQDPAKGFEIQACGVRNEGFMESRVKAAKRCSRNEES